MKRKFNLKTLFILFTLASIFIYISCKKDETVSPVRLDSFGPTGVAHGEDISFIGVGLDKVTSIIMPVGIEVPSSSFKTQTPTLIVLTVPEESMEGKITLKTPAGDITSKSVFGSSYIISVTSYTSPVKPGTNITFTGGFLNYVKQVTFKDSKIVTSFVSQSVNQLVVKVPMDAQSGKVVLSDLNKTPQEVDQDVNHNDMIVNVTLPAVTSLSPLSLRQLTNLTITGTNLDLVSEVDFPGGGKIPSSAFVGTSSPTQIIVKVPNSATNGAVTLVVPSLLKVLSTDQITVIEPVITALPPTLRNGVDLTITGTDLDLVASIVFPGSNTTTTVASTSFKNQSPTSIVVTIPELAISGALSLITTPGFTVLVSSPKLSIAEPAVTSLSTNAPNVPLTITGTDLDLVTNIIFPTTTNVASSAFISQTPTSIVVTTPNTSVPILGQLQLVAANGVILPVPYGGGCTTAFAGGTLLYSFDTDLQGWASTTYGPEVIAGNTVAFKNTDGHTCAGVAEMVIPFASYGQQTDIEISPSPPLNFTGKSKLHFWIKTTLQPGGTASAINGINFFLKTSPSNTYFNSGNFIGFSNTLPDGGKFSDGNWHEYVFNIAANSGSITVNDIRQFGVQIVTQGSAPSGGPATPPTVTLRIDDFWLE